MSMTAIITMFILMLSFADMGKIRQKIYVREVDIDKTWNMYGFYMDLMIATSGCYISPYKRFNKHSSSVLNQPVANYYKGGRILTIPLPNHYCHYHDTFNGPKNQHNIKPRQNLWNKLTEARFKLTHTIRVYESFYPFDIWGLNVIKFAILLTDVRIYNVRERHTVKFSRFKGFYGFSTSLHMNYSSECAEDYSREYCYYHCKESKDIKCKCTKTDYRNKKCTKMCIRKKVIPRKVFVFGSYLRQDDCDNTTYCENMYNCLYECQPDYDNKKAICGAVFTVYTSNLSPQNISSGYMFTGELIRISHITSSAFKVMGVVAESFFRKNSKYATDEYRVSASGEKLIIFKQNPYLKYFINFNTPYFDRFEQREYKYRPTTFAGPTKLFINQLNTSIRVAVSIRLGEPIFCNASLSRWAIFTKWKVDNIVNETDETIFKFPTKYQYSSATIVCEIRYICPRYYKSSKSKQVSVKSFTDFKWSVQSDVIQSNVKVECLFVSLIFSNVTIVQDKGPLLQIKKTILVIKDAPPSEYEFYCILLLNNEFLKRIISFTLVRQPNFVCLYMYQNIPGGIVQCGHNGAFREDYYIYLSIYSVKPDDKLIIEGIDTIHLPTNLKRNKYRIKCQVIHLRNTFKIELDKIRTFSSENKKNYSITEDNKKCALIHPYIESPVYTHLTEDYMIIIHQIYYLMAKDQYSFIETFRNLISLAIIYYLAFPFTALMISIANKKYSSFFEFRELDRRCRVMHQSMLRQSVENKVLELKEKLVVDEQTFSEFRKSYQAVFLCDIKFDSSAL